MADLVTGQVLRVRFVCYLPNATQLGECVTHWEVTGVVPPFTDATAANIISADVSAAFRSWIGSNANYQGVGVQILSPTRFPEVYGTNGAGVSTNTKVSQPPQVSGLIRHGSATAYTTKTGKQKIAQGRMYVPFPSIDFVGSGPIMNAVGSNALLSIVNAIGLTKNLVLGTKSAQIKLGTYVTQGPGPTFVKILVPSTTIVEQDEWATQKRRGQYGRTNVVPF